MLSIIRILMLAMFAWLVFGRSYYTNPILYWCSYIVLGVILVIYWFVAFYVSERRAQKVLGKTFSYGFFTGLVPSDSTADLIRGRLCVCDGELVLVHKKLGKEYVRQLSVPVKDIKSIGFGTVAGVRKGFTVYTETDQYSFVSSSVSKKRDPFFRALGWKDKSAE